MPETGNHYDHVIVGAGVSGLTLAYYLAEALPPTTSILVVDKDDDPDYNISFWTTRATPFTPVMKKTWRRIAVRHGDRQTVCPLSRYELRAFWRDDFDAFALEQLRTHTNVGTLEAGVTDIVDRGGRVDVETTDGILTADWVFDSRSSLYAIQKDDPSLMLMQGLAIEIECETPSFDPETATLFDFVLDSPQLDFMYVLPYTEHYGLVNVAFITEYDTPVTRETCEAVIAEYIAERIGCQRYEVRKSCYGRLPLTTEHPERRPGSRVVPIGVRGGMMKASTSYAFTRILADAERTAEAIRDTGRPFYDGDRPWYYRWTDKRTARVFEDAPQLAQEVMFTMFTPEGGDLALSFLDERNSLTDNGRLFKSIPPKTLARFLRALAGSALPG